MSTGPRIAAVEQRHARHKRSANPSMPFHTFAATSILQEARHQASAVERLEDERKRRAVALNVPAQPMLNQAVHRVQDRQVAGLLCRFVVICMFVCLPSLYTSISSFQFL